MAVADRALWIIERNLERSPAIGRVVADAPILERFNQGFDTRTGEGGVQLWIPLE